MEVGARLGGGPGATTTSVRRKKPDMELKIPVRTLEGVECIAAGFTQIMFEITTSDGERLAEVGTGAGWGTDTIMLECGDKRALVRGVDLLKAWIATFDPKLAEKIPTERTRKGK